MNIKRVLVVVSALFFLLTNTHGQGLPEDGPLTIDESLQNLAERLLKGKQGSIVAIDPATGEVKAMASNSAINDGINRAIGVAYSPGSTFKTAQALTLLSESVLYTNSRYSCNKGFWRDKIHIACHEHLNRLDMVNALGQSCNSYFCQGFATMMKDRVKYRTKNVAINKWNSYMTSMGLGAMLGIDMEGEASGLMPDSSLYEKLYNGRWNGTTVMWVGMGQGEVRATPLQLCNLAAVIGNRGWYRVPHIHQPVNGFPLDTKYTTKHFSIANAKAFDTVVEGMKTCVTSGTASRQKSPFYEWCGKTGTAENDGKDHSVFIGFAPKDNPKIAICVYVENAGFGADLAAPVGALVIEQYLTGTLTKRSENHAMQWEKFQVVPDNLGMPNDSLLQTYSINKKEMQQASR